MGCLYLLIPVFNCFIFRVFVFNNKKAPLLGLFCWCEKAMNKKIVVRDISNFDGSLDAPDVNTFIRRIFWARGEKESAVKPYKLKALYSPEKMKGMAAAVELLFVSLKAQQRVLIVGDFDADGATSTALLYRCLHDFGFLSVDFLVPNRFEYGYGLTPEIVDLALQYKPDVIITVDNGISSIEGVKKAKEAGVNVVVTDHHLPGRELPIADAIVNPNQNECEFPSKNLAGVGVIYYVMLAFRKYLRENNWFIKNKLPEPNMAQYLDLVALGTVADVVPLDFNNRVLVSQGLERIRQGLCCAGIHEILHVAGKRIDALSSTDLGFILGPRLNAAGRLDDMSIGIQCLLTDDRAQALIYAQELDDLNADRKQIEAGMQQEAASQLASENLLLTDVSGLCLFKKEWHQGVIGILASRIKDKVHRPVIVFAETDNGELKGSGRSIPGIHLRDVLDEIATKNPSILSKFGGHAMAAGLSMMPDNLPKFMVLFDNCVAQYLSEEMKSPIVFSDGELTEHSLSMEYAQIIKDAGPWGQNFPEPVFHGEFHVVQQRIVGHKHLKLVLSGNNVSEIYDAIAFNVDLDIWPNEKIKKIMLAYKLDVNEFRGQCNLQLMVDYIEPMM